MFGMDAIEIFLYRSKCSRPTNQWIDMMKTIIIDAQYHMGHEIVWLARYEVLKVVLRTIIFNLFRIFFNLHPTPALAGLFYAWGTR